jgi:hypothetical protein
MSMCIVYVTRKEVILNDLFFTFLVSEINSASKSYCGITKYTRWFKYDRDYLCVNKSQFVPVIFEPPCTIVIARNFSYGMKIMFRYQVTSNSHSTVGHHNFKASSCTTAPYSPSRPQEVTCGAVRRNHTRFQCCLNDKD